MLLKIYGHTVKISNLRETSTVCLDTAAYGVPKYCAQLVLLKVDDVHHLYFVWILLIYSQFLIITIFIIGLTDHGCIHFTQLELQAKT